MNLPVPGLLIPGPGGADTVRLVHLLGGGAFGMVFLAQDTRDSTQYAVKFPQCVFFGGGPELAAFFNEVEAAKQVRHPNVVRVLHTEPHLPDKPPYLIMEYLSDGTLKARIDAASKANTPLAPSLIRIWADCLVNGMEAINAKMLHRDLKPDNIMMNGDTPKIADFGLSKLVGAATRSVTFKGRQHMLYMAPEGWKLDKNEIQIDMYALGIVLYEIAALKFPYKVPTDTNQLRDMHLFQTATPLGNLRPDLPAAFCHSITKLMEKRPQDRFPNWAEVRGMIDRAFGPTGATTAAASAVSSLVGTIGVLHDIHSKQLLEAQEREKERKEYNRLNEFQATKLMEELKSTVESFNRATPLAQITIVPGMQMSVNGRVVHDGIGCDFELPYGGYLSVNFFKPDQDLKLKCGAIRYVALVKDQDGAGLNFLLCQSDASDLYGHWVPVNGRIFGLVDPYKVIPRTQPFGFDQNGMKDLKLADHAMHIYVLNWLTVSVGDAFLQVAECAMQRRVQTANANRRPDGRL